MKKEFLFFSVLSLMGVACSGAPEESLGKDNSVVPQNNHQEKGVEQFFDPEPDLLEFMDREPIFRAIYNSVREKDEGLILFSVSGVDYSVWARVTKVDVAEEPQVVRVYKPTDAIFLATSCNGEYKVEVSLNGQDYQSIKVDNSNGEPEEIFKLRPSCMKPLRWTPDKIESNFGQNYNTNSL